MPTPIVRNQNFPQGFILHQRWTLTVGKEGVQTLEMTNLPSNNFPYPPTYFSRAQEGIFLFGYDQFVPNIDYDFSLDTVYQKGMFADTDAQCFYSFRFRGGIQGFILELMDYTGNFVDPQGEFTLDLLYTCPEIFSNSGGGMGGAEFPSIPPQCPATVPTSSLNAKVVSVVTVRI